MFDDLLSYGCTCFFPCTVLYLYISLRRSRDAFVPSLLRVYVCYHRFSSHWPAFTLTVHINALYNESVQGREEHASLIITIPLKIATLLNLETLTWAYPFRTDVLIVSALSRHYSVLRRQVAPDVSGHDHFSLYAYSLDGSTRAERRPVASMVAVDIRHSSDHTNGRNLGTAHRSALCIPAIKTNYFLFTTFIHAKLGISPPTRCLRCATDVSA